MRVPIETNYRATLELCAHEYLPFLLDSVVHAIMEGVREAMLGSFSHQWTCFVTPFMIWCTLMQERKLQRKFPC
jgi:hypothetical protein